LGRLLPSLPVRPSASVCSPGRSPQRPGPLGLTLPGSPIRVALTALGFGDSGVGLRDHHHLPGRSICRPPRSRRTGRSATSREVSRVPRPFGVRRPRRSVPEATGLRTIPLRRWFESRECPTPTSASRVIQTRPCGFWRLASPCACFACSWRRRPRGSFVAAFPSAHVPGPRFGLLSRPGRFPFGNSATPVGFAAALRSVHPVPRVTAPRRCRSGPPAVSPPRRPRVYAREIRPLRRIAGRGRMRLLGFDFAGRALPRGPPVPPRLLRTGPDVPRWPGLPWALFLSRVFVDGLCVATSGGANARGLRRDAAIRLQIGSPVSRLPFGVSKGPATNRSGGVSAGSMSPSEVFAPSVRTSVDSRRRVALRGLL
jgi:hypothetical protein